jgi:threonine/homoserine/homoserine lactone efflux protein
MFISFDPGKARSVKNPLAKIITFLLGIAALAAALIFSFVVFAVLSVIGAAFWLYLGWKTRALRESARGRNAEASAWEDAARAPENRRTGGRVIEGEAIKLTDENSGAIGPPSPD